MFTGCYMFPATWAPSHPYLKHTKCTHVNLLKRIKYSCHETGNRTILLIIMVDQPFFVQSTKRLIIIFKICKFFQLRVENYLKRKKPDRRRGIYSCSKQNKNVIPKQLCSIRFCFAQNRFYRGFYCIWKLNKL